MSKKKVDTSQVKCQVFVGDTTINHVRPFPMLNGKFPNIQTK